MRIALLVDRILIVLFAFASGAYKLSFGEADIEIFSHLGFSAVGTAAFGAVQFIAGVLCLLRPTRKFGAVALAGCNAVATAGLFAAGVWIFGVVSILFIAMAAVLWWDPPPKV